MRIAVTTPGGHVGSHVVRQLIRAGLQPRLLSRRPERLPEELIDHVEVVTCDQYQVDEIVAGTDGVDALYWVDPTTGAEDPLADYARATQAVIEAIAPQPHPAGRLPKVASTPRNGTAQARSTDSQHTEVAVNTTYANTIHLRCELLLHQPGTPTRKPSAPTSSRSSSRWTSPWLG